MLSNPFACTRLLRTARPDENSSRRLTLKLKFYQGYDRNHWQVNRVNLSKCYTTWPLQRSTKQAGVPKMTERSTRMVDRISRSAGFEHAVGETRLHISSSQKHMWPVPVLSIMHTWSTMNKFICSCEVQVRLTLSYLDFALRTIFTQQPLQVVRGGWSLGSAV